MPKHHFTRTAAFTALAVVAALMAAVAPSAAQDATPTCNGLPATDILNPGAGVFVGTGADEVIIGTPENDIILGMGGNDTICGGGGRDKLLGGDGNDALSGGRGRDVLKGGPGHDELRGGPRADRLVGGSGRDLLIGGQGNDVLKGGSGADRLLGGPGVADDLLAGGGTDECVDADAAGRTTGCVGADFSLTILHINDHHSHLKDDSGDLDFDGEGTRVRIGGFPSVVAKFDELEAAHQDDNVVKIHAGDAITGTLFYSLFKGEADAAMMNEICFDLFELGNHEFDDSDDGLVQFLDWLAEGDCDTKVLGANVVPAAGTPLVPSGRAPYIDPTQVIDYGGESVGYVGIEIAGKTKNSSSPLPTTEFLDEIETAQAEIDALEALGVDKIVLITHIQYSNDLNLASMVEGVDVIVGGDSHSLLGDFGRFGLNPEGPYPTQVTDAAGNPVCVVQAWQYSAVVGELTVDFDADGNVTSCNGTPHLLLGDSFQRRPPEGGDRVELEGAERQAVLDAIAAAPELSIVTPDAAAQTILDRFDGEVSVLEQAVIGTATEDLCLERIPGQGRSAICPVEATAMMGGDIQQLVTEAFRVRSFESDIALQNSGGVRIDIPMGEITIADAYELLPFANTIVNLEMTGAEIESVLEEAIENAIMPDGSTGAYPYAAGLTFDVDLTEPMGSRVSNHMVRRRGETEYAPLDTTAMYTVATNSFIASGQDGYVTFGEISAEGRVVDTFLDYAQSFIDYVEQDAGGVLSKLPASEYSTQSFVPLG